MPLDPKELNLGKRLLGTWGGDNAPDRDFVRYSRLLSAGRVDLGALTATRYSLEQVNQALSDLEDGNAARPLIVMNGSHPS